MTTALKRIGLGTLAAVIVVQFVRPERTNPPFDPTKTLDSSMAIPREVLAKLRTSCYDCHSSETRWPWYSAITPVNFLLASDVRRGRGRMNFSEWALMKPGKMQSRLESMSDMVGHREMPLKTYLFLHPEARLSDEEIKMITDWADSAQDSIAVASAAEVR